MLKQIQAFAHTEHTFVVTSPFLLNTIGIEKGDSRAKRILKNPRNKRVVEQLIRELRKDAPFEHMFHSKFLIKYTTDNFGYTAILTAKPYLSK